MIVRCDNKNALIGVCICKCNNMRKNRSTLICVALLTFDWNYIEYEFTVKGEAITKSISDRLNSVFRNYSFTKNTVVVLSDNIRENEPICVYLKIISSQIKFKILVKSIEQMIKRAVHLLNSYFGKYDKKTQTYMKVKSNRHFLQPLWNKIIELKKCPWITREYNDYINTLSKRLKSKKQIIRFGAYYVSLIIANQTPRKKAVKNNMPQPDETPTTAGQDAYSVGIFSTQTSELV